MFYNNLLYQRILTWQSRSTEWFKARAHGAYAKAWLFFLSFTESSFLFIPPDILLVAILLVSSRQWFYYAALTTVASLLGAVFGYAVAVFFYDTVGVQIVNFYHLSAHMESARLLFNRNAFWAVFTAAFTPIPYKVAVLAAGFLKIDFFTFLLASILGRGLRYTVVAYAVRLFGKEATTFLSRYSVGVTVAVLVVIAVFFVRNILF
ncbi:DedA family protein [Candidatus Kaiserbacteria bacterium]|nr:DedA family protein [Candidatus Kaiserbacteria bacterium]